MPETENRSLEDIEMHFSDDSKGITDRHIAYVQSTQNYIEEVRYGSGGGDTNADSIHCNANDAIGSRNLGEIIKSNCGPKNVHENRGFVGDTLE